MWIYTFTDLDPDVARYTLFDGVNAIKYTLDLYWYPSGHCTVYLYIEQPANSNTNVNPAYYGKEAMQFWNGLLAVADNLYATHDYEEIKDVDIHN